MSRDPKIYLQDILEAIGRIREYTQGVDEADFRTDMLRQDAVIRNLEVIGEAAKRIPEEIKQRHSGVSWRKMAGLRDVLIHQYFGIDTELLWDTVANKLDAVEAGVKVVLKEVEEGES